MDRLKVLLIWTSSPGRKALAKKIINCGQILIGEVKAPAAAGILEKLRAEVVIIEAGEPWNQPFLSLDPGQAPPRAAVIWASVEPAPAFIQEAVGQGVHAILNPTWNRVDWEAVLKLSYHLAVGRFALEEELAQAHRALETRADIERAKGFLMERWGIREGEAYHRMRRAAMDARRSLGEIAQSILFYSQIEERGDPVEGRIGPQETLCRPAADRNPEMQTIEVSKASTPGRGRGDFQS
ncbi:MAG: ANTAR domain-containing protein [Firmicutes bacterium]|nr:ANTAR domain-containing protein [Bacillota bacterium]